MSQQDLNGIRGGTHEDNANLFDKFLPRGMQDLSKKPPPKANTTAPVAFLPFSIY